MFSRMVVSNRKLSWKTTPSWSRSDPVVPDLRSAPSKVTLPESGSYERETSPSTVLLPEPLPPTTATFVRAGIVKLTPSRLRCSPS
jgi:hypothetical protein